MGSKGQSTTQTSQTYTPNAAVAGAGNQAITGAEAAAATPFQEPIAPVAGFNPTENQAFSQYLQLQGIQQPYNNTAANLYGQAANTLSTQNIANNYNPLAANVTAQLQNIFGQQQSQNNANLVQSAGGIGADRIAVGQGNLANQQGLAAGQTYANLYQQAVQQAALQGQLQQSAGQQFAGLGSTAANESLAQAQALLGSGQVQQQQTQQELNAPYQNILARIAYQFQTPQYLAGIAGGLAPALGGTTNGTQVTTPAQPNIFSQILGLGTAGVGAYGAFGGFNSPAYGGGNAFNSAYGGNSANPLPGLTAADYGPGFADGGATDTDTQVNQLPPIPGIGRPNNGFLEPIPYISMPMGGGHSGPLTGGINTAPPSSGGSGNSTTSDMANIAKTVATLAPLFAKQGGGIPHYLDAGAVDVDDADRAAGYDLLRAGLGTRAPDSIPGGEPPPMAYGATGDWGGSGGASGSWDNLPGPIVRPGSLADKAIKYFSTPAAAAPLEKEPNPHQVAPGQIPLPVPYPGPGKPGSYPDAIRLDKPAKESDDDTSTVSTKPGPITSAPASAVTASMMPQSAMPYPDALKRDIGQKAVRSPWEALISAGAAMLSTPGSFGTGLGAGLKAGVQTLEGQRKELRSEQELNDKAQALYQAAQTHLDKYNRMTPAEKAYVDIENKKLDQGDDGEIIKPMTAFQRSQLYNKIQDYGEAHGWTPERVKQEYDNRIIMHNSHVGRTSPVGGGPLRDATDAEAAEVRQFIDANKNVPRAAIDAKLRSQGINPNSVP